MNDVPVEELIALVRKVKEICVVLDATRMLQECRDLEKSLMALRSSDEGRNTG